jgi:hypothetical protein
MPRDGLVWNTGAPRRRFDEAIDRMRGHAFGEYGAVFPYPPKQDAINNSRNS